MQTDKSQSNILFLGQLAFGFIFLYPAYVKLGQSWIVFAQAIDAYKLVPDWAVIFLAYWLPWIELGIGLLIVAGFAKKVVRPTAALLLLAFFLMMLHAQMTGQKIDCGCGFSADEKIGPATLLRDMWLLAFAIFMSVCAYMPRKRID